MDQSRPPERLDFTNPNWQAWRSAFQTYRAVSQLDREEQHTQVREHRFKYLKKMYFLVFCIDISCLVFYTQLILKYTL